ncbi:UNVERIFIED_CONTAM: hypothetical protein K2H54_074383 [Gekko kuhli]
MKKGVVLEPMEACSLQAQGSSSFTFTSELQEKLITIQTFVNSPEASSQDISVSSGSLLEAFPASYCVTEFTHHFQGKQGLHSQLQASLQTSVQPLCEQLNKQTMILKTTVQPPVVHAERVFSLKSEGSLNENQESQNRHLIMDDPIAQEEDFSQNFSLSAEVQEPLKENSLDLKTGIESVNKVILQPSNKSLLGSADNITPKAPYHISDVHNEGHSGEEADMESEEESAMESEEGNQEEKDGGKDSDGMEEGGEQHLPLKEGEDLLEEGGLPEKHYATDSVSARGGKTKASPSQMVSPNHPPVLKKRRQEGNKHKTEQPKQGYTAQLFLQDSQEEGLREVPQHIFESFFAGLYTPKKLASSASGTPKRILQGKEARLLELWEREKNGSLKSGLKLLTPPVFNKVDIAKLWGFLLFHLNMPQVLTIPLDKKKKDDIIDLLDTSYKPLLVFLNSPSSDNSGLEKDPDLLDKIFLARSISIKIVERLIVGRKPRSSLDIYPDWLTDTGFLSLLRNFLKTAETSDTKADYYLWDVEGTQRVPVSRSQWTDWLKQAIHAMKIRSQQMKEEQEQQMGKDRRRAAVQTDRQSRWAQHPCQGDPVQQVPPQSGEDCLSFPSSSLANTSICQAGELGKEDDDKRLFTVGRSGDDFEKPIKKGFQYQKSAVHPGRTHTITAQVHNKTAVGHQTQRRKHNVYSTVKGTKALLLGKRGEEAGLSGIESLGSSEEEDGRHDREDAEVGSVEQEWDVGKSSHQKEKQFTKGWENLVSQTSACPGFSFSSFPALTGQETLQFLESPLLSVEGNKKRNPLDQLFHFELSPEFSVLPPKPQRLQHLRDNEQQKKLLQAKTEQITEQIPEGIDSERNVVGVSDVTVLPQCVTDSVASVSEVVLKQVGQREEGEEGRGKDRMETHIYKSADKSLKTLKTIKHMTGKTKEKKVTKVISEKSTKGTVKEPVDCSHLLSEFWKPIERSAFFPDAILLDKPSEGLVVEKTLVDKILVDKTLVKENSSSMVGVGPSNPEMVKMKLSEAVGGAQAEDPSHGTAIPQKFSYANVLKGPRQMGEAPVTLSTGLNTHSGGFESRGPQGSRKATDPNLPRRTLDYEFERLLDDNLLEQYFEEMGSEFEESYDPRQRYVTRFRYRGSDPAKLLESYMINKIFLEFLEIPKEDILAVIMPPGMRETDICLISEAAYQRFWARIRLAAKTQMGPLVDFDIVPLFRGETRVLTISFRTTTIPEQDLERWLSSRSAKEGARSSSPGRTDEDKRKEKGGGETVCEGEWTQVKKRKDKHLRGSVTGGVYTRSQAGEGREVRQPNRFHVLQTEEGRDEMEVEPDQGRKNPVEETGEFFTFSSVSRPNPGGTFFFQGGSRSPSDKVARMELRMWRKMVTSVNDKELSHLVQNLREEHAEMNRMMQEGEDAFQSRCAELQISLSSQKGKVMKKNFDEQAWKLQLKMQMIRTRLAYCTNEGEERRERKDRKKDRKKESDKGNETDLSSMEEEEEGLEGEKKILEGKEVIEEDPEGKKVEVVRTENTEQEMEVTSQDNIVSVQEQESSEPSGVPLNQELYAKQLRLDLYPKPVNLDILSQACLEAELPISSETTPPL